MRASLSFGNGQQSVNLGLELKRNSTVDGNELSTSGRKSEHLIFVVSNCSSLVRSFQTHLVCSVLRVSLLFLSLFAIVYMILRVWCPCVVILY